jgi:hypothetical protein
MVTGDRGLEKETIIGVRPRNERVGRQGGKEDW